MSIVVSDPLALIAIEAGLVKAPLKGVAAKGNSKLDTTQRAAVLGEAVPVAFCRRNENDNTGGVLISPPATEARFETVDTYGTKFYYELILSEGQIGSIQVRDVFQRSCRVGSFTQTYNQRAGTWTPGNFITIRDYSIPECPYYCGNIGVYENISTLSFEHTVNLSTDLWNRQVHCFIRNGIEVPRIIEETTGSSNNYADLALWAFRNCANLPDTMIDFDALTTAAHFLAVNNLSCDILIDISENLADFFAKTAPYLLLAETRNNGKRGLRPLLPINNDYTIKTTAITPVFTFTEDHVQPDGLEISYVSLVDQRPFCAQTIWRQQLTDDFGIIRTSEVRHAGEAAFGPYEQHDLSDFCTREDHAVKVAAYIRARRKHINHTIRLNCRPVAGTSALVPGDIVRVSLQRVISGQDQTSHDFLYEISRISRAATGQVTYEMTHFPINSNGASLVSLDVMDATPTGILLESNKSGDGCDVNSSSNTTVPASTGTTGTPIDNEIKLTVDDINLISDNVNLLNGRVTADNSAALTALDDLGISATYGNGSTKSAYDLFLEIADKFEMMADGPAKTAYAIGLFGKSGADLIPLLNGRSDYIQNLIQLGLNTLYNKLEANDSAALAALASLGISRTDSNGNLKSAYDILLEIADKFAMMANGLTKTEYATALFGNFGPALIPLLNQGSKFIAGLLVGVLVGPIFGVLTNKLKSDDSAALAALSSLNISTTGGAMAVLLDIADEFAMMADGTTKTEDATALFGNLGPALIPLLNRGSDYIKGLAVKYIEEISLFGAPKPPDPSEALLCISHVAWDGTTLVVKMRIEPAGLAPLPDLGDLYATITSGTTKAYDKNGILLDPQPGSLPSLSFTGLVAYAWTAENYPDDDTGHPPPADRIFEGEFRVNYTSADFPATGTYRMPFSISATTGGFDVVTVLNDGLAIFEPLPSGSGFLLVPSDAGFTVATGNMEAFSLTSENSVYGAAAGPGGAGAISADYGQIAYLDNESLPITEESTRQGFTVECMIKASSPTPGGGYFVPYHEVGINMYFAEIFLSAGWYVDYNSGIISGSSLFQADAKFLSDTDNAIHVYSREKPLGANDGIAPGAILVPSLESSNFQHFAIVIVPGDSPTTRNGRFYINGQLIGTRNSLALDYFAYPLFLRINVNNHSTTATPYIHGIRYTPSALYSGSSFTPPTSITSLA